MGMRKKYCTLEIQEISWMQSAFVIFVNTVKIDLSRLGLMSSDANSREGGVFYCKAVEGIYSKEALKVYIYVVVPDVLCISYHQMLGRQVLHTQEEKEVPWRY